MLRSRHVVAVAAAAVLVGLAPARADAGDIHRHSGSVIAVERSAILVAEIGPWKIRNGQTVVTELRIVVTKATEFVAAYRAWDAAADFPGEFREVPLVDWEIQPGDLVTVECEHRGDGMIALKVTVLVPDEY